VTEENPYAPTNAPLEDQATNEDGRPSAGARFLWTAATSFPIYSPFVLTLTRVRWPLGALGCAVMALLTGLIAMCIPVKHKVVFIVPSILAFLFILFLIGVAMR